MTFCFMKNKMCVCECQIPSMLTETRIQLPEDFGVQEVTGSSINGMCGWKEGDQHSEII
jgi:hypothetical protein